MKKNFFKKLALVLAFVMTASSVNIPAAEAAAKPAFKSTKATVKVGQTKKYGTSNASKYSAKFKIGNKSVATIKYSTGSKAVKVTGVAEGKTTLRADFKSYKTKKVTTVRIPVTVKAAAPVVTEAVLSGVKQTASNAFTATFTADASKKFTKDDFAVAAADGSTVLSVNTVEFAADGLTAKVTLYGNFSDGVTYNVSCGDVTFPLAATVGAVARIVIITSSAQVNVSTPIDFTLFDATGIDVTPSIALDTTCIVSIAGTYSGADIDKASKAKITMDTVGTTADVTVSYNTNTAGATDITATQTITCVEAQAALGNKLFVKTEDVNDNSKCARFYLGLSDEIISVKEDTSNTKVYFCAKNDKGDVIDYDSYEVESSNDSVMTVNATVDRGKFAELSVNGGSRGNAQINITAIKNGKATYYTVPVSVTTVGDAVSMTVSVSRSTMSNVNDSDYSSEIKVKLLDAEGKTVESHANFTVITTASTGSGIELTPEENSATVTAANAQAKTYTIKVTGADNKTGKTFVKNVNISVRDLKTKDPLNLTYQIETNTTVLEQSPLRDEDTTTDTLETRLYATSNGLFAGYVRDVSGSGITVAEGNVTPTSGSAISGASVVVKYGTKTFAPDSLVSTGAAASIGEDEIIFKSIVPSGNAINVNNDSKHDSDTIARTGSYTLQYEIEYLTAKPTKQNKTLSFTVKNSMALPTITVATRVADSLTVDDIKKCLKASVDMNNNTSDYESITGLTSDIATQDGALVFNTDSTRATVKYAVVGDKFGEDTWYFWIPINATFRTE